MKSGTRVIGLAGWSGSGKTTLITKALPHLVSRGLRVSTLKHAHHGFDVDKPGKDSFMHRSAGATEVMVSSQNRWALMTELRGAPEPSFQELLGRMASVDLVLIEGFKRESFPKVEVYRTANGKPLLHPEDRWIVAVASDRPLPQATLPVIDLNDIEKIADVLMAKAVPIESLRQSEAVG